MNKILKNIDDLRVFAKEVLDLLPMSDAATVLGLYGNLGAGKTALTKEIAFLLGIKDGVLSPTFVIMKVYELSNQRWKHLIHIDAYRLESSKELLSLGFNDLINDKDNLIIIEWPDLVSDIMPEHSKINLSFLSENEREVNFEK